MLSDVHTTAAIVLRTLLFILTLALSPLTSSAQSANSLLAGTVVDEAGALVVGTKITAFNLRTVTQRHATTDDQGRFVIPLLPPGPYILTAQREGFATVEVRNLMLDVNDRITLRIKLKIGDIGETVTVIERLAGVQQPAGPTTIIDRTFIEKLPVNGRTLQTLIELAPGTVVTRTNFEEQGQFSVNGQRANANYFTVDGVSANFGVTAGAAPGQAAAGGLPSLSGFGTTGNLISLEAVEEFRIATSAYAPEFGRTPGAQVSITSRSGTNELHGAAFNYFRDDALNANDWFANRLSLPKPATRQHNFGGVLGGPIKRDKLLFFSSYEGLRLRQPQVAFTEVPTLAARAAAPDRIKPFFNAFPPPNGRETNNGLAEFAASYSEPSRLDAASVRLDYFMSNRLAIFGRYNLAPSEVIERGSVIRPSYTAQPLINPSIALSPSIVSKSAFQTQTLTLGATYSVRSNIINETRANLSLAKGETEFAVDSFGGATPLPSSLFFPESRSTANSGFQLLLEGGIGSNLYVGKIVDNKQRQFNVVNNVSIFQSKHHRKFGIDYRRLTPVYGPVSYNQLATFTGVGTLVVPPIGTFESGSARTVHIFGGAAPRHPVFHNLSAYAQDVWRMFPSLTVTYGLRWELNTPPYETKGNHPLALRTLDALDFFADYGSPLWKTTYSNFAPRLGVAYQISRRPGRELLARAGVGLFYDLGTGQAAQGFGSVTPFFNVRRFDQMPFPLTPAQAQPLPTPGSFPLFPVNAVVFDPNLKLPRSYQGNVSLEQSLGRNQALRLMYVTAIGRRLLREDVVVGLGAATSVIRLTRNTARSSYHAMQIQGTRRLSRGLQGVASYTWSKSIDNGSSDALTRLRPAGTLPDGRDPFGGDKGPSDFDVRHSFSLAASYDLPKPRSNATLRTLFSDWTLDAIFYARTATPVNVVTRTDVVGNGLVQALTRPDLLPDVPLYINDPTAPGGRVINRAAFKTPIPSVQGSLGQNTLRGFGASQLDLSLHRQIDLTERLRLQLRGDVFNFLNHPNFGNPIGDLSNPQFGQSTQTLARSLGSGGINGGLSPIYQIGGPRSIQLGIKLLF